MVGREVLDGGLTLITDHVPVVSSLCISVWLRHGSRHDSPAACGLSDFAASVVADRMYRLHPEETKQLSIDLITSTKEEYVLFFFKTVRTEFQTAVRLMADMILDARFPQDNFDRERLLSMEYVRSLENNLSEWVEQRLRASVWPGHGLGRPPYGLASTVSTFTRDDVRSFVDEVYVGPNIIVLVTSNIDHSTVRDLISKAFRNVHASSIRRNEASPHSLWQFSSYQGNGDRSEVYIGVDVPSHNHTDEYVTYLLRYIIDDRLRFRVEAKFGMAHFSDGRDERSSSPPRSGPIDKRLHLFTDAALLPISFWCANAYLLETIEQTLSELRALARTQVTAIELSEAKKKITASLIMNHENNAYERSLLLGINEIYHRRGQEIDEIISRVIQITAADVQRVADKYFANIAGVAAGPIIEAKSLKRLGLRVDPWT